MLKLLHGHTNTHKPDQLLYVDHQNVLYTDRGGKNFDLGWQCLSTAVLERLTEITNARCR